MMQWILAAGLWMLLPLTAAADGKVFPPTALPANVTIPDQRALIHFTNGVERLVIETRFTGAGTNFAWVVPLPSEPVVEEATTGLLPTLQYLFRPQIVHQVPNHYLTVLAVIGVGYLLLVVRPSAPLRWLDIVACLLVAIGVSQHDPIVGLLVLIALFASVVWIRLAKRSALVVLGVATIAICLAMMTLPRLAKSRAGASTISPYRDVSILDRQVVGIFETTTISSKDPQALQSWLRDNGFAVSTNSEPVIESYVEDGWVFVAAKVRRDKTNTETSTPHPLSFTFKTEKPVYPMRLTGVDNGPLRVELYVFGEQRAKARHFKVERCTLPGYPKPPPRESWSFSRRAPETPNIVHPLLRRWVDGSPVATKLTATLSPADMRQDVWLDWSPFSEKRSRLFSRTGATTYSLNLAFAVLAVGLLLSCTLRHGDEPRQRRLPMLCTGVVAFSVILAAGTYFALPKTEVRFVQHPALTTHNALFQLQMWLMDDNAVTREELSAEAHRILTNRTDDPDWRNWTKRVGLDDMENYLVGGRIREEDSPGNFTFRQVGNELEFVTYDAQGAAHVLRWR